MEQLVGEIRVVYNLERDGSRTEEWDSININIRTAVLATIKHEINTRLIERVQDSFIWGHLVTNEFA